MNKQYIKVKNKNTQLFWYGFSKGEGVPNEWFVDNGKDNDVLEEESTWYDLNVEIEKTYVNNNFNDKEHEIIKVSELEVKLNTSI